MSSSVAVAVNTSTWTVVMAAGLTGIISNEGNSVIRVAESTGIPTAASDVGHTLNRGEKITMTTPALQEIYSKSYITVGNVVVTSA